MPYIKTFATVKTFLAISLAFRSFDSCLFNLFYFAHAMSNILFYNLHLIGSCPLDTVKGQFIDPMVNLLGPNYCKVNL